MAENCEYLLLKYAFNMDKNKIQNGVGFLVLQQKMFLTDFDEMQPDKNRLIEISKGHFF